MALSVENSTCRSRYARERSVAEVPAPARIAITIITMSSGPTWFARYRPSVVGPSAPENPPTTKTAPPTSPDPIVLEPMQSSDSRRQGPRRSLTARDRTERIGNLPTVVPFFRAAALGDRDAVSSAGRGAATDIAPVRGITIRSGRTGIAGSKMRVARKARTAVATPTLMPRISISPRASRTTWRWGQPIARRRAKSVRRRLAASCPIAPSRTKTTPMVMRKRASDSAFIPCKNAIAAPSLPQYSVTRSAGVPNFPGSKLTRIGTEDEPLTKLTVSPVC